MKSREAQDAVVLNPEAPATAAVIWLHGLGADGHDFVPIVPELELGSLSIRFVFPHAPVRPVTLNNGMRMRAWYDIPNLGDLNRQDEAGIRESQQILLGYVQKELDAGIPAERIVLAGFSQGGAIALHTGLRYPQRLAGIQALSTYLPLSHCFEAERVGERKDTPILMCHGEYDPMLPLQVAEWTREVLTKTGYEVEWHQYPMQHQVCAEEIDHIGDWLRTRLA